MTLHIPPWLAFVCQIVGEVSLLFTMGAFALAAFMIANSESARRRRERELGRQAEESIERAGKAMRFLNRYGDGFHAYGVELTPGPRTRRTLAAIAADPLHRSRMATVDELIPKTIDLEGLEG